ncbi:MAG: FKBP-type peptidyl-prolyl cis-trans isomerase [Flavobacteriales bacterium]|nr:FKBP-type peptidyl-prolyl cis-trans isomerase [Flavobacteriales bacterium]
MILRMTAGVVIIGSLLIMSCSTQKGGAAKLTNAEDSLAYALGVSIGENFTKSNLGDVNFDLVMKGVNDNIGKTALMDAKTADDCVRGQLQKREEAKSADARKAGEDFLAKNKDASGVVTTETGLQYKVNSEGSGPSPDMNDKVTVHYHGTLTDGSIFDSSVDRGQPATFGLNQVIPGWTEGLQTMKEGGKTTFYVPQNLAYGAQVKGKIPGFSTLIFDVELIKVEPVE